MTRRVLVVGILKIVILTTTCAMGQTPPVQKKPAMPKVSEPFGKAAFLALKAIERDESVLKRSMAQFRDSAVASINVADAEAQTESEKNVIKALREILLKRMQNNLERFIALRNRPEGGERDLLLYGIQKRETACFDPFEENLRLRSGAIPNTCRLIGPMVLPPFPPDYDH